jgi:phage terminase small subunit
MADKGKLPPLQERFCEEWLKDPCGARAYMAAGYKAKNADVANAAAARLLGNVRVQERIAELQAERKKRVEIKADDVLRELLLIATSDIGQVLDFTRGDPTLRPANEIPENARRALASVKVKRTVEGSGENARNVEITEFRFWDKLGALDRLAKHLDLLKDRVEVTGKDGEAIAFIEVRHRDSSGEPG